MKIYLENRSETRGVEHNKFYLLETKNSDLFCKWGAISSARHAANQYSPAPRVKIIKCNSRQDAISKLKAIQAKKESRGYCVISRNSTRINQRPQNGITRDFGIEIETNTNLSKSKLSKRLRSKGLKTRIINNYVNSDGKKWDIKNDGSCGYEVASPIIHGEAGIFDLKLSVDKIKECLSGHLPDANCGIHITVSTKDLTSRQHVNLFKNFVRAEKRFYEMCNSSRQDNDFCRKMGFSEAYIRSVKTVRQAIRKVETTPYNINGPVALKYYGLNLSKLPDCVEFRMFQSELSPRKVGFWARACIGFVEYCHKEDMTASKFRTKRAFLKAINFPN